MPMRVRSMVGLIPLFAVDTIEPEVIDQLPGFQRRMEWFMHTPAGSVRRTSRRFRAKGWSRGGC